MLSPPSTAIVAWVGCSEVYRFVQQRNNISPFLFLQSGTNVFGSIVYAICIDLFYKHKFKKFAWCMLAPIVALAVAIVIFQVGSYFRIDKEIQKIDQGTNTSLKEELYHNVQEWQTIEQEINDYINKHSSN